METYDVVTAAHITQLWRAVTTNNEQLFRKTIDYVCFPFIHVLTITGRPRPGCQGQGNWSHKITGVNLTPCMQAQSRVFHSHTTCSWRRSQRSRLRRAHACNDLLLVWPCAVSVDPFETQSRSFMPRQQRAFGIMPLINSHSKTREMPPSSTSKRPQCKQRGRKRANILTPCRRSGRARVGI